MVTGTLLAFLRPEVSAKISQRTLTFDERVSDQRAIEEVYWRHRIWPKDNPQPKPPLDAVISQAQLEKQVEDYLRKSQLVADHRGRAVIASELQAEMERMAAHTKQPEVLHELFEALGNDPFVIAECLARPILAERLAACLSVAAGVSPAPTSLSAAETAASTENPVRVTANLDNARYKLAEIAPLDCAENAWAGTSTFNAPDARGFHTAVWTGSEMIVWGGFNDSPPSFFNTGGRYTPATASWTATNTTNAPTARDFHTAVWTGSEMVVWGGGGNELVNTGGRYNPTTDSWTATSTASAPAPRDGHTAVWTGSEMIVWGGRDNVGWFNTGGRYNPQNDSWTATNTTNAPDRARRSHRSVDWQRNGRLGWN